MSITLKNGKYYCRFQINGERHHYLCNGAVTKKQAEQMENAFKYKVQQQQNGVIVREKKKQCIKLKEILEIYRKHNEINNRQYEPKAQIRLFKEYFGENRDIETIRPQDVEELKRWLSSKRGLKPTSINRYLSTLSKSYSLAIDNKLTERNPLSQVKKLKEPRECIKFYTEEEENLLVEGFKLYRSDMLPLVICAFQTGLRISNIKNMKWGQVDLENRIIEIQPQDNKGFKLIRLYISDKLYRVLINIERSGEYIFVNPKTGRRYQRPADIFRGVCKRIGLKNIGFHGIRHTVGTRLAKRGLPINVVQAVLAHSDIRTTMRYVHVQDNSIKEAIEVLNSYN